MSNIKKMIYSFLVGTAFLIVLLFLPALLVFKVIGKWQMCGAFYPEVNRLACLATTLPGTAPGPKKQGTR